MWTFGRQPIQKAKTRKSSRFRTGDPKKLLKVTEKKTGVVHANLYHGIQTFKKKVSTEELAAAWESGDWARTMRIIPWNEFYDDLSDGAEEIGEATFEAGEISMEALPPNINSHMNWDMNNPRLRKYITDRTASLVVGIQSETQEMIQDAVANSFNEALTPRDVAKRIKASIGLFPGQERALTNYQLRLMADGTSGTKLETMVSKYEDKLLDYRSRMIARTEMRGATNQGQLSVWREASNQGLIDKETAKRVWLAEGPDPCDDCLDMDGEETGIDEPWIMPDGTEVETPPWDVHPNCNCGAELVI